MKAAILDLDGTIIDSVPLLVDSFRKAFAKFGIDVPADRIKPLIGMPRKVIVESLSDLVPGRIIDDVLRIRDEIYSGRWKKEIRLVPEAILFIKMAKKLGYRIGLVTSSNRKRTMEIFNHFGIGELFDCIVTADDVSRGKPDPEPILKALECLESSPDEAIFVGDSKHDEEAARASGVRFWRVEKWEDFREIKLS